MEVYRVKTGSILPLGKQGENLSRQIQFDLSRWISNFGPGTVQLLHQRSGDETPYPVAVEQEGNLAVWTVTSADTAAAGTGRAELQYYVGDALAKSETWMTKVLPALGPASETPPEAQQGWVDQVLAQVARITGMTAQAVELPAGSAPTADYADGVLTIGIPLGGDVSEAQIAQAVAEYLSNNPIAETDPTVPDWAKQPEKPSYTADEVGAVSSETLPDAINTALAQAKESGEFDGAAGQDGAPGQDGITPTIGDNGNWYLGDTDTGKPSRGENGQAGADGRDGADGQPGADGKSAYQYAQDGGYTGTEAEFAEKLAQEMPDKLPNPNALTFTGAVTGSYDGSEALTVEIPSGGSGGGTSSETADIPVTAEKAFSASVLELNHVSDNQYVAQHDSVLFEATEDTTLSVGNDNMIGSPYSANVGTLTMATVAYTEIENGYALDYADDYTGLKAFMNQRFGFNANIKSGRTYTIRFYVNAASVGNVYLYLVNEKTEPGTLVGGGNIRTGTVCQITFTADADYTFVRIPIQTLPAEITKITLCEGDVPLEYGNGAESYALLAGEKVWLSGVWNLNCVGIGKFYESPLALTSLNGIPTQNGAINSCATNKVWVNMGDSIWTFGASTGGIGTITDYMLALCGGTWHNIATGGTTMASRPGDYAGTYDALDFWKLADAVVAGDYTDAKAAAAELTSNFANIDSIDWAAVNYITVAYGTNDIDFGAEIDNESNLFDTATICGALRYGIKAINSAYPNIRFKVLGLLYRNADSVSMAKIVECNNALKDAAAYVGAEFIDGYGVNEGNRSTYLYDGTHPNGEGKQRIAETLARNIHDIWYS